MKSNEASIFGSTPRSLLIVSLSESRSAEVEEQIAARADNSFRSSQLPSPTDKSGMNLRDCQRVKL